MREFGKYSQLSVSPELGYFQELKMDESLLEGGIKPYSLLRQDGLFS